MAGETKKKSRMPYVIAAAGVVIGYGLWGSMAAMSDLVPGWILVVIGIAGIVSFVGGFVMIGVQAARTRSEVRQSHFVICPDCRHDLRGLGDEGNCPECGEPFVIADLERVWRERSDAFISTKSNPKPFLWPLVRKK